MEEADPPPRELADQPAMVVTSLRMPVDLYQRLKAAADRRGITMAALLRGWAELELAAVEGDRPTSTAGCRNRAVQRGGRGGRG